MKTLIVYTSQTGFTKRYAEWIAEELSATILTIEDAKKEDASFFEQFDAIIYGGWAMAGGTVSSKWFLDKALMWKGKKLALFCVGASPAENPDVETALHNMLTDEQRQHIKAFYCQGGLSYEKMKTPSKLAMKAFVKMLNKKNASPKDLEMAKWLEHSYDISDKKYIEPIIEYVTKE